MIAHAQMPLIKAHVGSNRTCAIAHASVAKTRLSMQTCIKKDK